MNQLSEKNIAIVGDGKMGRAMATALKASGFPMTQLLLTGPRAARGRRFRAEYGARFSTRNAEAAGADILILAVKPDVMPKVLAELRGKINQGTIVVSIAAGVPLQRILDGLGVTAGARCMPTIGTKIRKGITGWLSQNLAKPQTTLLRQLFRAFGKEFQVAAESYLDVMTAVCATGAGLDFYWLKARMDAAVREKLPYPLARELVLRTALSAILLALDSGDHLAVEMERVATPGGTTWEGIHALNAAAVPAAVADATRAALQRASELSPTKG